MVKSRLGALFAVAVFATSLQAQPLPQPKIDFVQGFGAASFIPNGTWQKARQRNFPTAKPGFFPRYVDNPAWPLLTRSRTLECIKRSDIFVFSGHSGPLPVGMHVLQVSDARGKARDNINAGHIKAALAGARGPRLVVVNGCRTTDPSDGVPVTRRITTGFGITSATKGRAYLGWSTTVLATTGENTIGRLFGVWTTMRKDATYPTLAEAVRAIGSPKHLVLIGDSGLRYKTAFALQADNDPRVKITSPMRLFLDSTGATTALATIDFGATQEPMLKRLGSARFLEMRGTWQRDRYVFKDSPFTRLVERLFVVMAASSKGTTVKVHEATWTARPEKDRLRITVRLHVTATAPKQKPSVLRGEYRLLGVPETRPGGK